MTSMDSTPTTARALTRQATRRDPTLLGDGTRLAVHLVACLCACLVGSLFVGAAHAQMLRGQWVDETEAAIRELRTVPLRIIVLDAEGQPVPLQPVDVHMRRHAFPFGAALSSADLNLTDLHLADMGLEMRTSEAAGLSPSTQVPATPEEPDKEASSADEAESSADTSPSSAVVEVAPDRFEQPVWRALSAISLERLSGWPRLEAHPDERDLGRLEAAIAAVEARGMTVRLGPLVSADPEDLPPWAALLRGRSLMEAVDDHVADMLQRYGRRVSSATGGATGGPIGGVDLLGSMLTFDVLGDRLGTVAVRRLFEKARTLVPGVRIGVHFEDSLTPVRLRAMLLRVEALRQLFAPFDYLTLDANLEDTVHQPQFARALDWIADLRKPVVITGLTVDGRSATAAAVNLEAALRTLFASPMVEAIYFPGLGPEGFARPQAALIDDRGQPTPCGQVFDGLVHGLWWDRRQAKTDELGNIELRLFAGTHELSARLPGGREARLLINLRPGDEQRVVVLQPMRLMRMGPPVEDPLFD